MSCLPEMTPRIRRRDCHFRSMMRPYFMRSASYSKQRSILYHVFGFANKYLIILANKIGFKYQINDKHIMPPPLYFCQSNEK